MHSQIELHGDPFPVLVGDKLNSRHIIIMPQREDEISHSPGLFDRGI